jgi:lipid-A-disaccharide synthase
MMTLYPFETAVYEANNIPVVFVGHPKADEISPDEGRLNQVPIREQLGIAQDEVVVAILPGSRAREVDLSGRDFLATALLLGDSVTRFVIPAANRKRYEQLQLMLAEFPELDGKVTLLEGQSRQAMTASNVVLVNSGTATLEAMLLRKPMVMSYRVGKITYAIVSRLVTTEWFALPNILAGRSIVPEFIQDAAVPSVMAGAVRRLLDEKEASDVITTFDEIHRVLKKSVDPGTEAAKAVLGLCES